MPLAAFWLNEYRGSVWGCNTCDNEHSATTLGDSVELRIQQSPFTVTKPCVGQRGENGGEVGSTITCEKSWHILQEEPFCFDMGRESECVPKETGSLPCQACTFSGNGNVLAGEASTNNVGSSHKSDTGSPLTRSPHIIMFGHIRPMLAQHRPCMLVDFNLPNARPALLLKPKVEPTNPGEQADKCGHQ
jgi:hypothetical protein